MTSAAPTPPDTPSLQPLLPPAGANPQEALLKLLQIEREARRAETLNALRFTIVNAPRQLLDYQQAILWHPDHGVQALSGLSTVDKEAPFVRWLNRFLASQSLVRGALQRSTHSPDDQQQWQQWLPENLWLEPLLPSPATPVHHNRSMPWLVLARAKPWAPAEPTLLAELGEALGHALSLFQTRTGWRWPRKVLVSAVAFSLLLMVPIRQTVVAPVEVVPIDPVMVRVALEGVIDRFHIQPNQRVTAGQPLFDLDATMLASKLEVARNTLSVAEADLRQVSQQAMLDPKAKALVALKRGEVERRWAEVRYLEQMLERLKIRAPIPGIVVLNDVNEWMGRAVRIGEKVLDIADPGKVELLIRLPADEMMPFPDRAEVDAYLNIAPDDSVAAKLRYISYQTELTPEGTLAYRLKASLDNTENVPRVGLRGTARLYGERVALGYWMFRRPWSWMRQWLGGW